METALLSEGCSLDDTIHLVLETVHLKSRESDFLNDRLGILKKQYTFPNLSDGARALTSGLFQLISLAESFVLIYMGMEIAIKSRSWSHVGFIFFSIVFIPMARMRHRLPSSSVRSGLWEY